MYDATQGVCWRYGNLEVREDQVCDDWEARVRAASPLPATLRATGINYADVLSSPSPPSVLVGYDLDGTLVPEGRNDPLEDPPLGSVVITGRTWDGYDDLVKRVAAIVPVYIRGFGDHDDNLAIGMFKAKMINLLGVSVYYDNNPVIIKILRANCSAEIVQKVASPVVTDA